LVAGSASEVRLLCIPLESAGLKALLWMCQHCGKSMLESVQMMRAKTKRTREENDALNAWNRYMLQRANQT